MGREKKTLIRLHRLLRLEVIMVLFLTETFRGFGYDCLLGHSIHVITIN
jgi:hypothetical protein